MDDCLFCGITAEQIPSFKIYEDERHIAILDIYPAVRGQAIVIPKRHFSSNAFSMPVDDYSALMEASRRVSLRMDEKLGSLRTCMVMEGMEVDHAHIKLYPIYDIAKNVASGTVDLNTYRGFLSTKHGKRMPDSELEKMMRTFR